MTLPCCGVVAGGGGRGGGVRQECDLGRGVGGGQVAAVGGTVAMVQIMDN